MNRYITRRKSRNDAEDFVEILEDGLPRNAVA